MYFYEKIIRMALESTDLSQRDIARAIGVPATTLNDWLVSGVKPHVKNLIRLSEWSGFPMPAMLIDTDKNNLAERIIGLISYLTPDQQQQIVDQMETMIEQNGQEPPRF